MIMQLELFANDVHLRRVDPNRNMFRFYAVTIEPTLFCEWAVVRQWGRIGVHDTVTAQRNATNVGSGSQAEVR